MEGLRQWAMVVCTAAVVCSLLGILFPDNRLGHQGKMVLPCVFLCVLLSPLAGGVNRVKLPDFTQEEPLDSAGFAARVSQQTVAQVNGMLQQMLDESFQKYGWKVEKVVTDMDIAADGGIHMGQITIYVDEGAASQVAQIGQVAERRLGMPVAVAIWEEAS